MRLKEADEVEECFLQSWSDKSCYQCVYLKDQNQGGFGRWKGLKKTAGAVIRGRSGRRRREQRAPVSSHLKEQEPWGKKIKNGVLEKTRSREGHAIPQPPAAGC